MVRIASQVVSGVVSGAASLSFLHGENNDISRQSMLWEKIELSWGILDRVPGHASPDTLLLELESQVMMLESTSEAC